MLVIRLTLGKEGSRVYIVAGRGGSRGQTENKGQLRRSGKEERMQITASHTAPSGLPKIWREGVVKWSPHGSLSARPWAPSFTSCLILGKLLNLVQLKSGEAQGFKTGLPDLRTPNIFPAYTASSNPYPHNGPLVMNTVINNFPDSS